MNLDDFARAANAMAQTDQLMAAVVSMAQLFGAYYRALRAEGFDDMGALRVVLDYQTAILFKSSHDHEHD